MLETFGFFGFVVACVLLVERPWRNWRVDVAVEKVQAEPETVLAEGAPAQHAQIANITPQQIMQVHQAGVRLGRKGFIHQLYNPSMN